MQCLDRRRRAIALEQAEIADRKATRIREVSEGQPTRFAQAANFAPDRARLTRIRRFGGGLSARAGKMERTIHGQQSFVLTKIQVQNFNSKEVIEVVRHGRAL